MIPVDIHSLPSWILELFHIVPDRVPEGAEAWISFKRFPESGWGLLVVLSVLAAIGAIAWFYRREPSLSVPRKVFLACLRSLVLLAVVLALLNPVLEVSVERDQEAVTLVLVDDSLSFGISDAYPSNPELRQTVAKLSGEPLEEASKLSRSEIAGRLLQDPSTRFLERLAEQNLLKIYTFSDQLRPVATRGTPPSSLSEGPGGGRVSDPPEEVAIPQLNVVPRGPVTDLGGAIRSAVEGEGNAPVAAVVLVTDGMATAGEDPRGVGRFLAARGIPLHVIGIGDPSPARNLRIMALSAPERVFTADPLVVDVQLDHQGFEGETVEVELLAESDPSGDGGVDGGVSESLQKVTVTLEESPEKTARFEVAFKEPGRRRLTARIAPREGEAFENDNARSVILEVVRQAARVLLVSGAPSNEFRILRNLLRRDRRVELASWLMSADPDYPQEGNTILKKFPSRPEELFEYDVIVLYDVNPAGFPPGFPELLERFVGRHRGGVAFIAGEKFTARFFNLPETGPVRSLLPVVADTRAADEEYGQGRYHQRAWPIVPTSEAVLHPATRLSSHPDKNREVWAELPGVFWSFPVSRVKPGATTLLVQWNPATGFSGKTRPLLAYQLYGGGRVLFLGTDESWRWRAVSEEIYERFWMQFMRTLMEGRLMGDRRQLLLTDRETYDFGDVIRVSALIQSEDYNPSTADSADASVTDASGEVHEVLLEKDPDQEGWFRGIFVPREVGAYRIRLSGGAEKMVTVDLPDLEFHDPRMDAATLRGLAEATGGSFPELKEYADIPERIPNRKRRVVVAEEPRLLWDNAILLALVMLLLTTEWVVRKWNRLP